MRFIVHNLDKPDSLNIRQNNRDAHLAFLKADGPVKVETAGPLLSDDGAMIGSMLIVEAEDKAAVQAWLKTDPYTKVGLTAESRIHGFLWAISTP